MPNCENVPALQLSGFSSSLPLQRMLPARPSERRGYTFRGEQLDGGLALPGSVRSSSAARPGHGMRRRVRVAPRRERMAAAHILDEAVFRSVLIRERQRAERFEQHVALMLITIDAPGEHGRLWTEVTAALVRGMRETDVMGWAEQHAVLGVVLPECGAGGDDVLDAIEQRVRAGLASSIAAHRLTAVRIECHLVSQIDSMAAETVPAPVSALYSGPARTTASDRIKRALDIVFSLTLLVLLSPVFLLIAALVRVKSPGPILFRQTRVGERARPFTILKFRTMHVDVDEALHQAFVTQFINAAGSDAAAGEAPFKIRNDPRVTPIGRFLRKSSLDELPQLWNVLRGDMSLVGPRPPLAYELEQYRRWHWRRVLDAKPGVTGLWQVAGRSRTTFDGMVRLDLRYVRTRSLWTDIKILLATPNAVISGRGAC